MRSRCHEMEIFFYLKKKEKELNGLRLLLLFLTWHGRSDDRKLFHKQHRH